MGIKKRFELAKLLLEEYAEVLQNIKPFMPNEKARETLDKRAEKIREYIKYITIEKISKCPKCGREFETFIGESWDWVRCPCGNWYKP